MREVKEFGRAVIVCAILSALMFLCTGCKSAALGEAAVSPEITERAAELSSGSAWQKALDSHANALATTLAAQKLTGEQTLETTQAIMEKLNTLEASLVKSASQQTGGDPKASPSPPAKANTQQTPVQVATPGDFFEPETLVELATRLYSQGVNVNMKTRDELEAIDARMNGGQAVTGAMFQDNRASAVTSKRSAVRFVPRGSSVVQWQNYSTQSTCGPGGCPPRRSR